MTNRLVQTLLCLGLATQVAAQTIELATLGSLQLTFVQPTAVEDYPAQPIPARVAFRPGEAFTLVAPAQVRHIEYLVANGADVLPGQAVAIIRGPEAHHLQMEYEASEQLFAAASRRHNSNRELYERKAIPESQWIEVSEKFYAAQMEYEHQRHFHKLVIGAEEHPDTLTLVAPFDAIVDYTRNEEILPAGDAIARFIPRRAVRVRIELPNTLRTEIATLQLGQCSLQVEQVAVTSRGFFVDAWSEPVKPECGLIPGQQVMAIPLLRTAGYRLPKRAVFQWQGASHVLLRDAQSVQAIPVTLLGSEADDYVLRCNRSLAGREILVSSVSAVQGLLMGLGGE